MATERATANLPQTAQTPYFNVVGGRVIILEIVGEVATTAIQDLDVNAKLVSNPTVGADVDLCAQANIRNDAIGTQLSITGTLADALVETPSGAFVTQEHSQTVCAGTIDLYTDASRTGATKWLVRWIPFDAGAYITAA